MNIELEDFADDLCFCLNFDKQETASNFIIVKSREITLIFEFKFFIGDNLIFKV